MLWSVKHQHGPIFKQQTLAWARSALLLLPEQLLPPHKHAQTRAMQAGRIVCVCWSPSAALGPPCSTPKHSPVQAKSG